MTDQKLLKAIIESIKETLEIDKKELCSLLELIDKKYKEK